MIKALNAEESEDWTLRDRTFGVLLAVLSLMAADMVRVYLTVYWTNL